MKTKNLKSALAATSMAMAVGLACSNAAALTLFPKTLLEDDNIDSLTLDANGNGLLDVGDQLTALLDFGKIIPIPPSPAAYDPAELTAISVIEVKAVVDLGGGSFRIEFGPAASFEATYGPNAMIAFYADPADNLNLTSNCLSVAGCTAAATDGALWAVLGLYDADNEWFSIGSRNVAGAAQLGAGTKVATVNFSLNVDPTQNFTGHQFADQQVPCIAIIGSTGFTCAGDGQAQWVGSADILGGDGLNQALPTVRSDTDATVNLASVPEPGSLALLGLGLGLGALVLRRRQAA
jgi:hypothetical protein